MELRPLGRSNLRVSAVGLGTRGHRAGLRDTDPADAERAIAVAIEAGCALVECGPRWGESERLVGAAVRALRARDRVVVATRIDHAGPRFPPLDLVPHSVDQSLRASRLDALPLVWLDDFAPWWLDDSRWPELAGTLAALVRAGKVLTWGVGLAADDEDAARVVAEVDVTAIGVRASLFDRRAEALIVAAAGAGRAVIARAPLADGALGGALVPTMRWRADDERAAWPPDRITGIAADLAGLARFTRNVPATASASDAGRALLDGLRRHPEVVHATVAELAIAAVLGRPEITAAVVGVRRPAHAATWWPIAPLPVPTAIARALAEATWGQAWYRRGADER